MKTAAAPAKPREQKLDLRQMLADLVADGLIRQDQVNLVLMRAAPDKHPITLVAEAELESAREPGRRVTAEAVTQWLAGRSGVPYLRIDPLTIDVPRTTAVMSYAYAAKRGLLAVRVSSSEVTIATAEPYLREWQADLVNVVKQPIKLVLANPADIQRYLVEFYALARSVKASEAERGGRTVGVGVQNLEQLMELGRAGKLDANDQHVVNIVDWLLQYAFDQRASDIHMEPRRDTGNIRFRIDGVLHEVYQIPATVMAAVTSRFKILARMDLAEKRRPQDGRIKTRNPDGKEIELRVASLPTAFGEKLVMRIFDPEVLVKDFAALGFSPDDSKKWNAMISQPTGIILVTGPTGSGKTTTLYSTLKQLATPEVNVCTVEDPIELVEPSFNQMQVHAAIDLTFASGVRALMRQDPDIIMVGEIRDLETADMAIQASLTGHLVLSTLHTNDSPSALTRLLDLGVPSYLMRATLLGVMAQRLLRKLCPHCKKEVPLDEAAWTEMTAGWKSAKPKSMFLPAGCLECRETGFLGRVGIYEMMPLNTQLRGLITDEMDLAAVRQAAMLSGMLPLRLAGALKVAAGLTAIDEVLREAPPPNRAD